MADKRQEVINPSQSEGMQAHADRSGYAGEHVQAAKQSKRLFDNVHASPTSQVSLCLPLHWMLLISTLGAPPRFRHHSHITCPRLRSTQSTRPVSFSRPTKNSFEMLQHAQMSHAFQSTAAGVSALFRGSDRVPVLTCSCVRVEHTKSRSCRSSIMLST